MLPFLARVAGQVTAVDVDLIPFGRMKAHINFPSNIEAHDALAMPLEKLPGESFDFITALDVLEHVDDLASTVRSLLRQLKPGGRLIVSQARRKISSTGTAAAWPARSIRAIITSAALPRSEGNWKHWRALNRLPRCIGRFLFSSFLLRWCRPQP